MKKGCCSKCQAKASKSKPKNVQEQPDEQVDVKQEDKVSEKEKPKIVFKVAEKEKPKTDSSKEDESQKASDQKEKEKEKKILTWQHTSTKKEKSYVNKNVKGHHGNNFLSQQNGFNQPFYRPRSMMYRPGSDPSNWWPVNPVPRGGYPAFMPPPTDEPYGCGGPTQPYQAMARPTMFDGCYMSPYPPMAAAFPPPYWHSRPDINPMTRYTSYADNYSYPFL